MQEAHMKERLTAAKQGDEDARREVAIHCFETYKGRIRKLHSLDPAVTMDDLETTFFEGIFRHVPLADGRGDDFYHIGQRGYWAVMSELRAIATLVKRRGRPSAIDSDGSEMSFFENLPDDAEDFREIVVSSIDASERVQVLANASLKTRTRQALDVILSGQAGDPTESGFNMRLAAELDVSPQRASQIMANLRDELAAVDAA